MSYSPVNSSLWNKLYKKNLWENLRAPEDLAYVEDAYISFRIFERCKNFYVLDEPLYFYRMRLNAVHKIAYKTIASQISLNLFVIEFVENRVPKFFTAEHLRKSKQLYFDNMIIFYVYYADNEGRQRREDLRNKIIENGKKIGLENCSMRTKLAYFIFLKFPCLLKPIYLFIWPFITRICEKCLENRH